MTHKKIILICLFVLLRYLNLNAQVITINPQFATQSDNITITYDATKGNSALIGLSTVYAHAGVITSLSSTPTSWKYVQGNWGTDDAKVKMTNIGNNKFQLSYNITNFYGVPTSEKVLKLAFVFRNVDGSIVGRESDGSDIFVPLSDGAFNIHFITPSIPGTILSLGDSITVNGASSLKGDIKLQINDSVVTHYSNDSILSKTFYATSVGKYKIILSALLGNAKSSDTSYIIVRSGTSTEVSPNGIVDGINYMNDSTVTLQLFAPYKSFVYAIGDFSNWELDPSYEMKRTPDGNKYWIKISGLQKLKEYRFQYAIDKGLLKIADPFSDKVLDPNNDQSIPAITYPNLISYPVGKTTEIVSTFQIGQSNFNWQYTNTFIKPASNKLIIYELLVRDFIARHDYQTLKDTLHYLKTLGINAIELMPINEFEGNESWGYNPSFYFAPDKYYGTKEALKSFIDECHKIGIAVIMDMVLNHSFGQSPMVRMYFNQTTGKPASNNPWFNIDATHPYNVGYDFNHESMYTQLFVDTVLRYWIREYKIDGYRFDLSKGFTQTNNPNDVAAWGNFDQSRINIWKRIADKIRVEKSDCYLILEHFADNSEETVLSNYGFMLWGNENYDYNEAAMGYSSDIARVSYKSRNWNNPNLVSYMESHDEERLVYKNEYYGNSSGGYNIKKTQTALARIELAACFFIPVPGPKMIWQFGEMGYDTSINYNGRIGNKPIRWDYLTQQNRRRLVDVFTAINHLKTSYPVFTTTNFSLSSAPSYKVLKLSDSSMNVLIAGNFGLVALKQNPGFQHTGWWYNYFTGDSLMVTSISDSVSLFQGEYRIYTDIKLSTPQITPTSFTSVKNISTIENDVRIYPNPTNNIINISFPENIFSENLSIKIFNVLGELVYSKFLIQSGITTIDLNNIPKGLYIIKLFDDQIHVTKKIIIN